MPLNTLNQHKIVQGITDSGSALFQVNVHTLVGNFEDLFHDDSFATNHDNSTAALVGLGGSVLGVLFIVISLYFISICVCACVFVIGVNVFALVGLHGSVCTRCTLHQGAMHGWTDILYYY